MCIMILIPPHLFSDDVLLQRGNEMNWWPRRAFIRCGQLVSSTSHSGDGPTSFKLSLRHMSLRNGPVSNSFSLCKGQNVILTLQVSKIYCGYLLLYNE